MKNELLGAAPERVAPRNGRGVGNPDLGFEVPISDPHSIRSGSRSEIKVLRFRVEIDVTNLLGRLGGGDIMSADNINHRNNLFRLIAFQNI